VLAAHRTQQLSAHPILPPLPTLQPTPQGGQGPNGTRPAGSLLRLFMPGSLSCSPPPSAVLPDGPGGGSRAGAAALAGLAPGSGPLAWLDLGDSALGVGLSDLLPLLAAPGLEVLQLTQVGLAWGGRAAAAGAPAFPPNPRFYMFYMC
jgi:hypothetical protein